MTSHDGTTGSSTRDPLERCEDLLGVASRVAGLGVWSLDLRTHETLWSPEARDLLHLETESDDDLEALLRLIEESERSPVVAALQQCAETGAAVHEKAVPTLPDGSRLPVLIHGEPVRDETERIVAIDGAIADITDAERAREWEGVLSARIANALDGIPGSLVFVDADWRIRFVNRRTLDDLGRTEDEISGVELWQARPADARLAGALRAAMASGQSITYRGYDETAARWLETTGFSAGDLFGIHTRDLTAIGEERDRLFAEVRRVHAQSRLLDLASDAILMRDLHDRVEYANPSAADLLGVDRELLPGRSLRELLGVDESRHAEGEAALSRTGRWSSEFTVRRPDGSERIAEGRWQLVSDPEGAAEAVFCVLTDVTERRRSDEVLLRTQRMESIGTLAGGIAHDLNNVLTPLLLSTQILSAGETDENRQRILTGMRQTIDRGADMIRQVLTFARGIEGQRALVDVRELVDAFARFCRDTLPKNLEIDIAVDDGGRPLEVLGDSTQLLQVLMNLATNARDAMPEGGRLALRARTDGDRVVIEVSDEGSGMDADTLARVFEPFYTTKGIGRGTGLGLSVSQAIARAHGGSLEGTSEPGRGTTFRLDLPRSEADATDDAAESPSLGDLGLRGARVLIIDDEDDIVEAASFIVVQAGGVPFGAPHAEAAKELLGRETVDVILTDLVMPHTTGRSLLDWIAAQHPGIPVVTMSGVPEQGARAAERDIVHATLDKPFTAEELLEALRLAVEPGGTG